LVHHQVYYDLSYLNLNILMDENFELREFPYQVLEEALQSD